MREVHALAVAVLLTAVDRYPRTQLRRGDKRRLRAGQEPGPEGLRLHAHSRTAAACPSDVRSFAHHHRGARLSAAAEFRPRHRRVQRGAARRSGQHPLAQQPRQRLARQGRARQCDRRLRRCHQARSDFACTYNGRAAPPCLKRATRAPIEDLRRSSSSIRRWLRRTSIRALALATRATSIARWPMSRTRCGGIRRASRSIPSAANSGDEG